MRVGGRLRLATMDLWGLYLESTGLAEARIDARALSVAIIPRFATETVCCSYVHERWSMVWFDEKGTTTYHGFMKNGTRRIRHFIKFVNATNTTVTQHQGTTLKDNLFALGVTHDISRQPNSRGPTPTGINTSRGQFMHILVVDMRLFRVHDILNRRPSDTCKSCDLLTPGSPDKRILISPLQARSEETHACHVLLSRRT